MGVDIQSLQKLLGHADASITQKHYAHMQNETLRKESERVAQDIVKAGKTD